MLLAVLALLVADCSGAARFTPLAAVLPTAVAGVALAPAITLPPVYYDTSSDYPECVGAGDALSALRRAETGGAGLRIVASRGGGPVPVTIVLVQHPASLDAVDAYLVRCRQYRITAGALGPARVQLRTESGQPSTARTFVEIRTPLTADARVFTRTLLARSGDRGLLVVIGPAASLPPALVDSARKAGLTALVHQ